MIAGLIDLLKEFVNRCEDKIDQLIAIGITLPGLVNPTTGVVEDKQSNDSALRSRLGDFIGRSIRFYFRRFFDPVPLNLTNEEHESYRHVDLSGSNHHTNSFGIWPRDGWCV